MTSIIVRTTVGYPIKVSGDDLMFPRLIGFVSFLFGIISLISIISLSGWTKSKKMGQFTTIIGILSLILILSMLIS